MSTLWSESSISFVNLKKTPEQLLIAEHQIDCGSARSYLKEKGIETAQYVQDKLSNLTELAEEIISLGNSFIVLFVNNDNYYISKTLSRQLKESEETISIVWFGSLEKDLSSNVFKEANIDAYIFSDYEINILKLFETNREQWESIDGVLTENSKNAADCFKSPQLSLDFIPSIYQTRIIPINKASSVGVMVGRSLNQEDFYSVERIISDLDFLHTNNKKGREFPLKLVCKDISKHPEFSQLLKSLKNNSYLFAFETNVNLENLTPDTLELFVQSGIKQLNIEIDSEEGFKKIEVCAEKMKYLVSSNIVYFKFVIKSGSLENGSERFNNLKLILNEGIADLEGITFTGSETINSPKLLPKRYKISEKGLKDYITNYYNKGINRKILHHETLLINGFNAYMTGIYGQNNMNGFTKHVSVENGELDVTQYKKLKEYTSINSAIYVNSTNTIENNILYSEGSNILKKDNSIYDENVMKANEANYYLEHLLTIQHKNKDINLLLDDYCRIEPFKLDVKKYSEAKISNSDAPLDFLRIENEDDLQNFMDEVDYFISTGKFNKSYIIPSFLIDSCRWMDTCSLTKLPRFRLNLNNEILPCLDCSKSIGSIDEMQFDVIQQTYMLTEEEQLRRDCDTCNVADYCSKCVMLPDFLSSEEYCDMRKQRPYISYYINIVNQLKFLKKSTGTFKDIKISDIMVSSKYVSYYTKHIDFVGDAEYFHEFINLFIINGNPVFFMPLTGKIYRLTEHLAVIMELMLKGLPVEEIRSHIKDMYKLEVGQMSKDLNEAIELFANTGSLKRAVI
jgi:hypothetical protein